MMDLWTQFGFYLWALTTALVVVALAWLAWTTFGSPGEVAAAGLDEETLSTLAALSERVEVLTEAAPHMQATLGRALQFCGLVRYTDNTGAQAFTLALTNARGEGFVLSSSVRGGLMAKPLASWASSQALSREEQSAIDEARGQA